MTSVGANEGPTAQTRASLLAGLQAGDESRWREFYDLYGPLIRRFALKSGLTEAHAEEVLQETAMAVAKHLPEFRYQPEKCRFKTWLLNQTTWRVKDHLKQLHRQAEWIKRGGEVGSQNRMTNDSDRTATIERVADPTPPSLEALWETEWRENLLATALQRVKQQFSDRPFQMFDLNVMKGWSSSEVARSFGVSVASVYLAKHRIAKTLKREISRLERLTDRGPWRHK